MKLRYATALHLTSACSQFDIRGERVMDQSKVGLLTRITRLPEFNIYVFAFLLNFVWEFLQMPLFTAPPTDMPHWDIVQIYAFATVADGFIMLIAYWTASAFARSR
jgi:hypothetical protein